MIVGGFEPLPLLQALTKIAATRVRSSGLLVLPFDDRSENNELSGLRSGRSAERRSQLSWTIRRCHAAFVESRDHAACRVENR